MAARDDIRETVAYSSVIAEPFAEWYSALVLSILASAISYYSTALYSDLLRVWRRSRAQARAESAAAAAAASTKQSAATVRASHDDLLRDTATHVATLKPLAVLRFVVLFITFVVLDFVALAVLPLTLCVPIVMCVFIWGGLYRWCTGALPQKRDKLLLVLILVLIAVGVWAAPKGLYIVRVKRVVVWDARSAMYSAAFAGAAALLLAARRVAGRRAKMLRLALEVEDERQFCETSSDAAGGASSARSLHAARQALKSARDATTVAGALLTGILGGQSLVLLKLVAEICKTALFGADGFEFEGVAVFLVISFSAAASAAHVAAFHFTLKHLAEGNARLMVPVHRLALAASASVGAAVYLEEWAVPETTFTRAAVYYGFSLAGLLGVCALLAARALKGNPFELFRPAFGALLDDENASVDGEDGYLERVEQQHNHRQQQVQRRRTSGSGRGGADRETLVSMWALGNSDERFRGGNDSDSDDSGMFFLARQRTQTPSPQSSARARQPLQKELMLVEKEQQQRRRQASGYESDESFQSAMDDFEGDDDGREEFKQGAVLDRQRSLNEDYPVPAETMVFPREMGTSSSFWVDAGLRPGGWRVRGPSYDADRVKVSCGEARMRIAAFEWIFAPDVPFKHMAARENGFVAQHHMGRNDRPFLLILNFAIPSVGHYVTYLTRRRDVPDPVFDSMLQRFVAAEDDAYRNARLKLIPGVLQGSFLVRKAVGAKPALLCQKLTTTYHRGDNYFEVCIDVGSSVVGSKIFAAVKGFASSLTLHLGIVLESKTRRELPERLLCGVDIYTPAMHPSTAPKARPATTTGVTIT